MGCIGVTQASAGCNTDFNGGEILEFCAFIYSTGCQRGSLSFSNSTIQGVVVLRLHREMAVDELQVH